MRMLNGAIKMIMMFSIFFFIACDKEENTVNLKNEFVIQGKTYSITQGILRQTPFNNSNSNAFYLELFNEDASFDETNGFVDGPYHIYIELSTDNTDDLSEGIYPYSGSYDVFSFKRSGYIFIDEYEHDTEYTFNTGEVIISKEENIYTIEFEFDRPSSNFYKIKGKFTGFLERI